jgi:hypothetical protein
VCAFRSSLLDKIGISTPNTAMLNGTGNTSFLHLGPQVRIVDPIGRACMSTWPWGEKPIIPWKRLISYYFLYLYFIITCTRTQLLIPQASQTCGKAGLTELLFLRTTRDFVYTLRIDILLTRHYDKHANNYHHCVLQRKEKRHRWGRAGVIKKHQSKQILPQNKSKKIKGGPNCLSCGGPCSFFLMQYVFKNLW